MPTLPFPLPKLEDAIKEICQILEQNKHIMFPWDGICEKDLWRELVACILGSRVRYHVVHAAMERMDKAYLFSEERLSSRYDDYEHDVFEALMGTKNVGEEFHSHTRYPYPQLKARQIREAVDAFYGQRKTVRQLLREARDVYEARRRLASEVSGLGPKQSSLFLRNIGYGAHVAVLDVHVLTYMNWLGLIPAPLESVRTVRHYETIENTFIEHATSAGYSPHYFDLAVWIVVRVAKKEYKI